MILFMTRNFQLTIRYIFRSGLIPTAFSKLPNGRGYNRQTCSICSSHLFGCGPDAFLTNEVRATLERFHKNLTLLKIDDIDNVGSIKLRVRSLVESLKISHDKTQSRVKPFETTPAFTKAERKRTIIAPFFTPFLSPLIPAAMKVAGFNVVNLPMSDSESGELGLKYSNNEVCYPATLIVGDVIKAFKSGRFNPDDTAVAITQTGGQCRASNYIALIKRALLSNGYRNTPVVSLSFGSGIDNYQPGFKIPWLKLLPVALSTMLYSDVIAKMYYATVSREKEKGVAAKLKEKFLDIAKPVIERNNADALPELVRKAAKEFNDACTDIKTAKVGIVGEIFLEFNPYAQKNVTDWLIAQRLEVVPPLITDFFTQSFVNRETKTVQCFSARAFPMSLSIGFIARYRSAWTFSTMRHRRSDITPLLTIFLKRQSGLRRLFRLTRSLARDGSFRERFPLMSLTELIMW